MDKFRFEESVKEKRFFPIYLYSVVYCMKNKKITLSADFCTLLYICNARQPNWILRHKQKHYRRTSKNHLLPKQWRLQNQLRFFFKISPKRTMEMNVRVRGSMKMATEHEKLLS